MIDDNKRTQDSVGLVLNFCVRVTELDCNAIVQSKRDYIYMYT